MNKTELIAKVAEDTDLTKKQASAAVEAVLNAVMSAVADGDKVALPGFGTFEKKHRDSRMGLNPRTGEAVEIPAAEAPTFKAGKVFKDRVKS